MSDDPYTAHLQATRLSHVTQTLSQGAQPVDRDLSIIAQNAGTTAANIAGPYDGSEPLDDYFARYTDIRTRVFNGTLALAGAESVVESFEGTPQTSSSTASTGNSGGVGGIVLKSGKHAGKTIADVYASDGGYIEWTARESKNTFLKQKSQEFLDSVA